MNALKRLLRVILTGSASLIIAACYGVPVMYGEQEARLRVNTENGEPVTGLQVYPGPGFSTEYSTTDTAGEAVFRPILHPDTGEVVNPVVRDVDGPENLGCFARTEVTLGEATEMEVVVLPNEYRYSGSELTCRIVTPDGLPVPGLVVNLGENGCDATEYTTDEEGQVTFHPLINPDGGVEPIFVNDVDGSESLGYFGTQMPVDVLEGGFLQVTLPEAQVAGTVTQEGKGSDAEAGPETAAVGDGGAEAASTGESSGNTGESN